METDLRPFYELRSRANGGDQPAPFEPLSACMGESSETGPIFIARFEDQIRCGAMRPHRHDFHQIWLIDGGNAIYSLDFIDMKISRPSMIFAPAGSVHAWKSRGSALGFLVCFAEEYFRRHNVPASAILDCPPFDPVHYLPRIALDEADYLKMRDHILHLEKEYKKRLPHYQPMLAVKLWELLLAIKRLMPCSNEQNSTRFSPLTLRFLRLLANGPAKIQTPAQIANHLHVSRSWLNQVIRQETGKNTTEQIQNHVLREAKRLLAHSDLTIQQVAFELGFEDPGYFSRLFRLRELKSPNEFREEFR